MCLQTYDHPTKIIRIFILQYLQYLWGQTNHQKAKSQISAAQRQGILSSSFGAAPIKTFHLFRGIWNQKKLKTGRQKRPWITWFRFHKQKMVKYGWLMALMSSYSLHSPHVICTFPAPQLRRRARLRQRHRVAQGSKVQGWQPQRWGMAPQNTRV